MNLKSKFYLFIIFIATLFIGIGYASINSVSLDIKGTSKAKSQDDIYITEVNSMSGSNTLSNVSNEGTLLTSRITLENDKDSTINIKVILYNSTNNDYIFKDIIYAEELYNNSNIKFSFDKKDEIIEAGKTLEVNLTFYYENYNSEVLNFLESTLNFKFELNTYIAAEYSYTGKYETFIVPQDGNYKIELWGASGGDDATIKINAETNIVGTWTERNVTYAGGYGGYTAGNIYLEKDDVIYVYVGEQGKRNGEATFNGGGYGGIGGTGYEGSYPQGDPIQRGLSGGGATDVRLTSGPWNNFESLKSRIMVAAGGGGTTLTTYLSAGNYSNAGGLIGFNGGWYQNHPALGQEGKGGTQTSGGQAATIHFNAVGVTENGGFGYGGNTTSISSQTGAGGGGGGYYGGGSASGTLAGGAGQGGGGGSSYISGHSGCNAVSKESTSSNIIHTGNSQHYSGYVFSNTLIIDGFGKKWTTKQENEVGTPTFDNSSTTLGNIGDGHAKITYLSNY